MYRDPGPQASAQALIHLSNFFVYAEHFCDVGIVVDATAKTVIIYLFICLLIITITISSLVTGLKKSYFPLIRLPSCYRTVCYWTVCYRTVQ